MGRMTLARRGLTVGIPAAIAIVLLAVPASPAQAETVFEGPEPSLTEVKVDSDGIATWDINFTADSAYIATWERTEGVWKSADEASAYVTALAQCQFDARAAYLQKFTTGEEFRTSPTTQITEKGSDYIWNTDDPETVEKFSRCNSSEWSTDQVTVEFTDEESGAAVAHIPLDLMGPGNHELFLTTITYPEPSASACSVSWPGEGGYWTGYGCPPEFETQLISVAVPYAPSKNFELTGPIVSSNSPYDQTVFSNLPPVGLSERDAVPPVLLTIAVTLILAILIALPTALLESTLDENQSRVAAFVRRLLPGRARVRTSSVRPEPDVKRPSPSSDASLAPEANTPNGDGHQ
jgi:hypothetical protein